MGVWALVAQDLRYRAMTNSDLPGDIGGTHPLRGWLNRLKQSIARRTLLPGLGYRLIQGTDGVRLFIDAKGGGSSTVVSGYRGQWTSSPPSPYMEFDFVIVLQGAAAGTYLSVTDNNSNDPATGIGWVQIAPGDAFGRWS